MRCQFVFFQTPARRLKNDTSTGHADSPATIVIGKAYLRATQPVCAAPKIVSNVALFKKDMKMDEDLTGTVNLAVNFVLSFNAFFSGFYIIFLIGCRCCGHIQDPS